ncbi:MAG: 2-succinyl-5-enolpyruvyl-6-hydroxy-3-cyclohexene-1-carboxylic-acid synthase [Bacteroides sp.]|nr:2-succinyl-5-enolpyruvyl-6-hydroxy-3-cyclohexene-1-carboxylic-acid synthase [Bacteroides sp.]
MYSEKNNILQLTSLLKSYGIKEIVVCPGSRNAPLVHTFVKAGFNYYTVVDERSAGFFALGIILETRNPVAVCCTSGTALSNLSSAVAEAYYQELPLLVLSADRPVAWIGQMDGQTLPQPGLFGSLVKYSVQLPEPTDKDGEWYCNRLINEALLTLTHHGKGPVHINIPVSEPLFSFEAEEIPVSRSIITGIFSRPGITKELKDSWKHSGKVLIVVGQQLPGHGLDDILSQLASQKGCVILAETLANLASRPLFFTLFDTLLYADEEREKYRPELLITIGGHIVSKRLKAFLRRFPASCHWHINHTGEVVDTYQQVTHILEGEATEILSSFITEEEEGQIEASYLQTWTGGIQKIKERLSAYTPSAFSGLQVVRHLVDFLPLRVPLHIANSSSIRLFQLFEPKGDLISTITATGAPVVLTVHFLLL